MWYEQHKAKNGKREMQIGETGSFFREGIDGSLAPARVVGVCRSGMFTESFSVALYLWAGSTSMEALSP